jgi:hypothetical protein
LQVSHKLGHPNAQRIPVPDVGAFMGQRGLNRAIVESLGKMRLEYDVGSQEPNGRDATIAGRARQGPGRAHDRSHNDNPERHARNE